MFVHSVYFWLRPDLSEEQHAAFLGGIHSLTAVETIRQSFLGVPASTDRPVIERGYSHALILVFDDKEGHDAYQVDPIHLRFVEECGSLWSRVLIFDSVSR